MNKLNGLYSFVMVCTVIVLTSVFVIQANATLIDNVTYVTDTTTNLKWLKLTETAGTSYNNLHYQLQTTYKGWSLATASQVSALWFDAGLTTPYDGYDAQRLATAISFISLIGDTLTTSFGNSGYYYDAQKISDGKAPVAQIWIKSDNRLFSYGPGMAGYQLIDNSMVGYGAYLVSPAAPETAPVPEPGTMALLGLGMAGLAVYGKRRKGNKA